MNYQRTLHCNAFQIIIIKSRIRKRNEKLEIFSINYALNVNSGINFKVD